MLASALVADPDDSPPQDEVLIEAARRLSRSRLWSLQRRFYDQRGARAWSERLVPTHATSNAFMAEAYASVVCRLLEDLVIEELVDDTPIPIVELGGGSGYFAFLFLRKLQERRARAPMPLPPVQYVVTDFTATNLEHWRSHPQLAPLVREGLLDVAQFDAERDTRLELAISGQCLEPGSQTTPMVVIANYVFDSIVHDVFRVRRGCLEEGLAELLSDPKRVSGDDSLDHLRVRYVWRPCSQAPYDDAELDAILAAYIGSLGNTAVPFPLGALRCLSRLDGIANGRLFVLAADKGYTGLHQLSEQSEPEIVSHGSVSMMVNFDALGRFVTGRGGFWQRTAGRDAALELVALSTLPAALVPRARAGFGELMDEVGPLEVFELSCGDLAENTPLAQLLALLRIARWDPQTLLAMAPRLQEVLAEATEEQQHRLRDALAEVWKLHYQADDGEDLPFELAVLLYGIGRHSEALHLYEHSLAATGPHEVTYFNMGLCHYKLGQVHEALEQFEASLAIEATYGPARQWRLRCRDELARSPLVPPESARCAAAAAASTDAPPSADPPR